MSLGVTSFTPSSGTLLRWGSPLDAEIQHIAQRIGLEAKRIAPVKTGFLRGNITERRDSRPASWLVVANTPYAIFVEQGTRYMAARNYLKQAMQQGVRSG